MERVDPIGVARGRGQKGHDPPKFLKNIIILCFERRFAKQNRVVRLKSYILPPKILGWLRHWLIRFSKLNTEHNRPVALHSESSSIEK